VSSPEIRRAPRAWAVIFLAWTLVGLIYTVQDVTRRLYLNDPNLWRELDYWLVRVYLSAALTPAILWLGRRWPLEQHAWVRRTGMHLLFAAAFAVVEITIETAVLATLWPGGFRQWYPRLLIAGFHSGVIAYWVVLGVQAGARYYRELHAREQEALRLELHASELNAQLVRAQLNTLKMQLQPHFLFNTLNAIVVLVRQQKGREAEETLARFSDLLRLVLDDLDADEVPLSRELEYLRLYLAIEQVRFSDRLSVAISIDPAVLDAAVPHMGLQPIVENAIRHGIGRRAAAGSIEIRAARAGDAVQVTVTDDGPGFPPSSAPAGRGIGLANTRARLEQLYGAAARLEIASGNRGGASVTMIVPYHVHEPVPEDVPLLRASPSCR
jgi:signal transduction histidine kinase